MKTLWRRLRILSLLVPIVLAAVLTAVGQLDQGPPESGGGLFGPGSGGAKSVVSVQAQFTAPTDGRPGRLFITATIKPGWHIYSITQPLGGPLATKIEVTPSQDVPVVGKFLPSVPPDSKKEPAFDNLTVETHHGARDVVCPDRVGRRR